MVEWKRHTLDAASSAALVEIAGPSGECQIFSLCYKGTSRHLLLFSAGRKKIESFWPVITLKQNAPASILCQQGLLVVSQFIPHTKESLRR